MELLTFAPVPFAEMLGEDVTPRPAQWDAMSRDIGIVSGLDRWIVGLRGHAETEREEAEREKEPERAERRRRARGGRGGPAAPRGAALGHARRARAARRRGPSGRTGCTACSTSGWGASATARRWRR